jgi:Zn-dependent M32 family carboxypeptidase
LNYFKANSLLDLEKNIEIMLEKKSKYKYEKVFEKYSPEIFINNLKKLFPEIKKLEGQNS